MTRQNIPHLLCTPSCLDLGIHIIKFLLLRVFLETKQGLSYDLETPVLKTCVTKCDVIKYVTSRLGIILVTLS